MADLAILGGPPLRTVPFPRRVTMAREEKAAVNRVMDGDSLSAFLGAPGSAWLGGPNVLSFEQTWAKLFGYSYAVSVNSWTTGLVTAVSALGLGPGDEMICPPFTMSASATCAVLCGATPIFADIDPETFTLDPALVEKAISPRTKALMVVHLFGLPADMDSLTDIANRHQLDIIEDGAQAPLARYRDRYVGALQGIGGFSLNFHKHIHTGEGGMIVTDDDDLARRCQLIRNHGENFASDPDEYGSPPVFGSNYRLTELQSAIGLVQLGRLPKIIETRQQLAARLDDKLSGCPGIVLPVIPPDRTHSFYVYPIRYNAIEMGVTRQRFIDAVAAELPAPRSVEDIALSAGYVKPLHLNAMFSPDGEDRRGLCPIAEKLYEDDLLLSFLVREPLSIRDIDDFAEAVLKVVDQRARLGDDS